MEIFTTFDTTIKDYYESNRFLMLFMYSLKKISVKLTYFSFLFVVLKIAYSLIGYFFLFIVDVFIYFLGFFGEFLFLKHIIRFKMKLLSFLLKLDSYSFFHLILIPFFFILKIVLKLFFLFFSGFLKVFRLTFYFYFIIFLSLLYIYNIIFFLLICLLRFFLLRVFYFFCFLSRHKLATFLVLLVLFLGPKQCLFWFVNAFYLLLHHYFSISNDIPITEKEAFLILKDIYYDYFDSTTRQD